jgi:hypothetical protein
MILALSEENPIILRSGIMACSNCPTIRFFSPFSEQGRTSTTCAVASTTFVRAKDFCQF